MKNILDDFRSRGIKRGGILLFRPLDTLEIIRKCREADQEILGLDGFYIEDNFIRPDMAESIDLSANWNLKAQWWDLAEQFVLQRLDSSLFFEITTFAD